MGEWKDVPGYKGIYQVSDSGQVRGLDRTNSAGHRIKGQVLKQTPDRDGYL